ncbi:MAG: hypothetical protein HWE15_13900 [Algoriphagus sp.]|uniref:DUF1835 domain-containing protein n=1 Tax=Algoriphagus sp. TaxID=1872435 RepID=UPI001835070D|nr:DUF1835 domain-containing protein [Algoriphagus sp.]NVJ87398.1 hypothetical protein [Algoriphagus sp.]
MIFHILNGDSLSGQFPNDIPGEKIIFRECLLDGPLVAKNEDVFWQMRKEFLEFAYEATDYDRKSKEEILKITKIPSESTVFFWFEEDLFCQVNFWKASTLLPKDLQEAYLVLPGQNSPYSFAHLSAAQLFHQWENALKLDLEDIRLFNSLWTFYQNADVANALDYLESSEPKFSFLFPAVKAWENMIPTQKSEGLPMQTLRDIQIKNPVWDFRKVFREFQNHLPIYGFGDLQVKKLWEKMKSSP